MPHVRDGYALLLLGTEGNLQLLLRGSGNCFPGRWVKFLFPNMAVNLSLASTSLYKNSENQNFLHACDKLGHIFD